MSDQNTAPAGNGGGISAKGSSLIAQIIASVWIAAWSVFKFVRAPGAIEVQDVIFSGIGIAACFMPVYFSIILDKVRDIRFGGSGGGQ